MIPFYVRRTRRKQKSERESEVLRTGRGEREKCDESRAVRHCGCYDSTKVINIKCFLCKKKKGKDKRAKKEGHAHNGLKKVKKGWVHIRFINTKNARRVSYLPIPSASLGRCPCNSLRVAPSTPRLFSSPLLHFFRCCLLSWVFSSFLYSAPATLRGSFCAAASILAASAFMPRDLSSSARAVAIDL